ncbi:tetratricopeptide repeat protein [Candidatus Ruminimicrobium bovinum]|uniref:tetratricopeptide repeat protein n=1 Tax=Candidatus Ruminimicrobium bovinum TaxID=3242779 RepID=UPI0039B98DD8
MNKVVLIISILFFCFNILYASNYQGYKIYLEGLLSAKKGDVQKTIQLYEKTLSYDKAAIPAYEDLAYIYLRKGDGQKALDIAKKMQDMDGESVRTNLFLGTFYLNANQLDLATKSWKKVLELDPKNETATVYLATVYSSDNKLKESLDYWEQYLKQQPESSEGYFQLGVVQEKLGLNEEAIKSYNKVNELKPDAREAYLSRARIYESQKDFKSAIKEYEKYIEVYPDNISILIYLGKCYFEEKKYKEAEDVLLKAKKIAPNNLTVYYLLGMNYEKRGNVNKSIDCYEFITKNEKSPAAFARLGYYYALILKFDIAQQKIQQAIDLEPLNPEFHYLAGLNYIDKKDFVSAKKELEESLVLKPDFNDANFYLAMVNDKLDNFEETEEILLELIEKNPKNVKAMNYLGYCYADRNIKLDKAEKLLNDVVSLYPNDPAFLDSLAWLYYRIGKYQQAEKNIFKAIVTEPRLLDSTLYDHFGDISVELNKLPQAWLAYSVATDMGSKTSKEKIKLVSDKITSEQQNKVLNERALHNFIRIVSFNASYSVTIKTSKIKTKMFMSLLFSKGIVLRASFPSKLTMPAFNVFFTKDDVVFEPKTAESFLNDDTRQMLDFVNFITSGNIITLLQQAQISQKGSKVTYKKDGYVIVINKKTGEIIKVEKEGLCTIKILSYKNLTSMTKIPSKLIFKSLKDNFECDLILKKLGFPTSNDFENNRIITDENAGTGTGKN